MVLKLDQDMGIDKLVREEGYAIQKYFTREVGIKSLGTNTYIGYCLEQSKIENPSHSMAQEEVSN